ncbi:XCL1 protein, partial [Centropus unirufus]|nr:XCL1 protein [Centropus unirufus]
IAKYEYSIDCLCHLSIFLLGSVASQSMNRFSCVNLSAQKLNIRNLVSYKKQDGPVEAIIFMTTRGVKICVKPNQKWVQTAIKKINERTTKGK